ncbi:Protein Hook 3, partial [Halocaridina rubra]
EHDDKDELGRILQLILGCAVNCESKQQYIEAIMNMEENVQKVIMEAIQELMLRESSPGILSADGEGRLELGPASFHPHLKTVLEQLETATHSRDETIQRCHELEQQISVLSEEKTTLSSENEKLLNRLDTLETGGDLGTSTLRYKDLKKQIDGLQDELYKLETSRDEYRTKTELLERENQEIQTRNEELQQLADEARSLKDEVDALREMSERAVVYEGTMETYKKKLEELSDLKRQVRILEEKNSDYMQMNMELEEEVKKSGTWRPQLELYKKQVTDLHQKLAEEAKKTDRQIFENKKLSEKMEALIQEKDRLTMERDGLKENIEELRCHVSTLTSPDTTSRPPSDLSDVDLLDVVPHEIRQRLIRLQHENTLLKQRAGEGDSSEQLPVLQTLVSDLQERQTSLTQENRWDYKGDFTRPIPNYRGWSINPSTTPSFSLFDACFNVDPNRKMKVFKKNLKWASESDLLILRQPKGLLSPNFLSSTLPMQQPRSLPPLPVSSSSFATQTSKESPIVIRHIHEFKLSPSPTNEDSGCCRTSPSSCEGCDDRGCTDDHSPDYVGTLDSGVSGVYGGTLESGMSGVYRCLSPVIPSIVEECTTHHITDIIPALGGNRSSSPPVLHHSHPAHNSCHHCYFQNGSQEMRGEKCSSGGSSMHISSPCPPRPHTVCSYNPPYRYSQSTSPVPNLPVSPPVSPLPNNISFCLTPSVVEVSTVQTTSVPTGFRKSSEQVTLTCSLPGTSFTTLTYAAPNPVSVSTSQNRKSCSGLSRPLIPPDSPTPHNSPRLPNSICATRSRACKSPPNTAQVSVIAASPVDIPLTETVVVGNIYSSKQDLANGVTSTLCSDNSVLKLKSCSDTNIPNKYSAIFRNHTDYETSMSSDSNEASQGEIINKFESGKPPIGKLRFPSVLKRLDVSEANSKDEKPKVNVIQNSYDTECKRKNDENNAMYRKNEKPVVSTYSSKINSNCKAFINSHKEDIASIAHSIKKFTPKLKTGNSPTTVSSCNNANTLSSSNSASSITEKTDVLRKSSIKSSPVFPRLVKETLVSKANNHVTFREPIVKEGIQSRQESPPAHYSPASPRERVSALPKTPTASNIEKDKKNASGITLMSDTLFTHFVISPPMEARRLERDVVSTTDTDTDLEILEQKLTIGMYAAPLVSSESCTSVSPDDGDEDPSATEYCSDTEDYNPSQFKPFAEDNERVKLSEKELLVKSQRMASKPKILISKTLDPATLVRTYSFFRKQAKAKKQRKNAIKEIPASTVNGGIVKTKNKTAKHVVAETFNAMFTLCTP